MNDFYAINKRLNSSNDLPEIPSVLHDDIRDGEAIIWIPRDLSRESLSEFFPSIFLLSNQLIKTDQLETGFWIKTSVCNEPPFLELSAKELLYITHKMGVFTFSLELYLHVQWFCHKVFDQHIDREYWTWLPQTRFDRSGLVIGGIDSLKQFDFHGWMPDFQASFCGGRYYVTQHAFRAVTSLLALEWEYDKREISFKHWIGKIDAHNEESTFAAYHLLRDYELMHWFIAVFESDRQSPPQDLVDLCTSWAGRLRVQNLDRINGLALEQVKYYHAMLDDLVGYIISGIKSYDRFVPYRVNNGLKNLRNYYLTVRRLRTLVDRHIPGLPEQLERIIVTISQRARDTKESELIDHVTFYFRLLTP